MTMRYLSVCSGIEAATVAWHPLGWQPVGFSEIEPFPSAVLAHHYPAVPNYGNLTRYQEWPIDGPVELVVGGTPCQSFSVAGLRQGMADPRGNLALTFLGLVDHVRPRWVVWENVPGVLSSNGGRDFGAFLGALGQLGYGFAYRVLDAQFFGLAQRRRRVFVVGYLGDWRPAAAVLFERDSLRRDTAPRREARESVAPTVSAGPPFSRTGNERVEADAMIPVAIGNVEDGQVATLSSREYKGLSCGRDGMTSGAVVQALAFSGQMSNPQVDVGFTPTLQAKNPTAVAIQGNLIGREAGGPQGVGASDDGVMYTLTKADVHGVAQAIPLDLRNGNRDPEKYDAVNRQGVGVGQPGEPAHTVTTACVHGVAQPMAFTQNTRDEVRYINGDGQITGALAAEAGMKQTNYVQQTMQVRRLTPVECERLQGFPDGWTNIPWRKKSESPDGPRYKALGNSMAVPVMRWIGQRITHVEEILRNAD
jgi:DNA (cytosine-5)-methyltransferase 1